MSVLTQPLTGGRDEDTYMKAYDFDAVTYNADIWCVECLPTGVNVNSDDVSPIFANSEWDYVPVCNVCGAEHDYVTVLTDDDDVR